MAATSRAQRWGAWSLSNLLPQAPRACTIVLRGASKDVLNEVERNLHVSGVMNDRPGRSTGGGPAQARLTRLLAVQDAMGVARNIVLDPRLVPGGGAVEIEVSRALAGARGGALQHGRLWPLGVKLMAASLVSTCVQRSRWQ